MVYVATNVDTEFLYDDYPAVKAKIGKVGASLRKTPKLFKTAKDFFTYVRATCEACGLVHGYNMVFDGAEFGNSGATVTAGCFSSQTRWDEGEDSDVHVRFELEYEPDLKDCQAMFDELEREA